LPSASHTGAQGLLEEARRAATERKARTGELTPAGNGFLGAGKEFFVLAHDVTRSRKK
jgi:hypothetical protein